MKLRYAPSLAAIALAGAFLSACSSLGIEDASRHEGSTGSISEAQALLDKGNEFLARGAIDDANLVFQRAVRHSGGEAEAVGALARSYLILRRPDAALAEYDLALARDPQNPRWLVGRGVALDKLGQHQDAQQNYRLALKHAETSSVTAANATINLALSLAVSGDRATASDMLNELGLDGRYSVRARHNLALVKALGGNTRAAADLLHGEMDQALADKTAHGYARLRTNENPATEIPIR